MSIRTITSLLAVLIVIANTTCYAASTREAEARRLINALGCKSCHRIKGDGGTQAPELDHIGSRMTRSQIQKLLASHNRPEEKGFMPSYSSTSANELALLSDFLYNLK